jgi:tRNA dimethylallyltransferase
LYNEVKPLPNAIIVLAGPTASGKTAVGIELAKLLNAEIVSADSMQVYAGMPIGSAQPTLDQQRQIKHYMIACVSPYVNYGVAQYQSDAKGIIDRIHGEGKRAIVLGGTGLYIHSLIRPMTFAGTASSQTIREKWTKFSREKGNNCLHEALEQVDPVSAERLHPNDVKRVVRALEVYELTGMPFSDFNENEVKNPLYPAVLAMLSMDRARLYERIELRVDRMMEQGLLDEVKALLDQGVPAQATSMQGLGYKQLALYLNGKTDLNAAVSEIKKQTRHYAKRQLTWFKRYADMQTFEAEQWPAQKTAQQIGEYCERMLARI